MKSRLPELSRLGAAWGLLSVPNAPMVRHFAQKAALWWSKIAMPWRASGPRGTLGASGDENGPILWRNVSAKNGAGKFFPRATVYRDGLSFPAP